MSDKITVLVVEPLKEPYVKIIGTELEQLQREVGGMIEVTYPFEENVGLIMNEEGKLEGLPLNRGLFDEKGHIYDIIAGTFLVAGLTEDDFGSLTEEQIAKYREYYKTPQAFIRVGSEIRSIPVCPLDAREAGAEKEGKKSSVMGKLLEKKKEAEGGKEVRTERSTKGKNQNFDLN